VACYQDADQLYILMEIIQVALEDMFNFSSYSFLSSLFILSLLSFMRAAAARALS
jgi:hypothetical protein